MFNYFKSLLKDPNDPRRFEKQTPEANKQIINADFNNSVKNTDHEDLGINIYQPEAKLLLTIWYHHDLTYRAYDDYDKLIFFMLKFFYPNQKAQQIINLHNRCWAFLVKHNLISQSGILTKDGYIFAQLLNRQANKSIDTYLIDRVIFYLTLKQTPKDEYIPFHNATYLNLTDYLEAVNFIARHTSTSSGQNFRLFDRPEEVLPATQQPLGLTIFDAKAQVLIEGYLSPAGKYVPHGDSFIYHPYDWPQEDKSETFQTVDAAGRLFWQVEEQISKELKQQGVKWKNPEKHEISYRQKVVNNFVQCIINQANYSIYGFLTGCYIIHRMNMRKSAEMSLEDFEENRLSLTPNVKRPNIFNH